MGVNPIARVCLQIAFAVRPKRIKAIAVASASMVAFVVQPPTPAQAEALWSQSPQQSSSRALHAAPTINADPPYQPPAKHGTNYTAPTAKATPRRQPYPEGLEPAGVQQRR